MRRTSTQHVELAIKRIVISSVILVVATSIAAVAIAQASPARAHASGVAKIAVRHTARGNLLVSSSGFTLYEFTRDRPHQDVCVKIKECSESWPALETTGRPKAGAGVKASLLSSINLADGRKQVTYDGRALYLYSGDSGPGETYYIGATQFGGSWYAISPSGAAVK